MISVDRSNTSSIFWQTTNEDKVSDLFILDFVGNLLSVRINLDLF